MKHVQYYIDWFRDSCSSFDDLSAYRTWRFCVEWYSIFCVHLKKL